MCSIVINMKTAGVLTFRCPCVHASYVQPELKQSVYHLCAADQVLADFGLQQFG